MRFLLDANAVIELLNRPDGAVQRRVRALCPDEIGVSAIALHELYYGAFKSQRQEKNVELVDGLHFEVVEFDQDDGRQAGEIRAELAKRGMSIGPYDVLIAGQARSRDLTLVTANFREFQRVGGLTVADWSGE